MSSYSGFSSRKIQDKYNHYIKQIISLLSQIIISKIDSAKILPFKSTFRKLQNQIKKLDAQKYFEPKFSKVLEPLTEHIQQMDCVKEWHSEPQKKKSKSSIQNNYVRIRNPSLDQTRRTISFSIASNNSNAKAQTQKGNFLQQNRYNFQLGLTEQDNKRMAEKLSNNLRSKKIYRSRQVSTQLLGVSNLKHNFDQNQIVTTEIEVSMEQLMKKNPLIERKLSAHKKRRLIKYDFPQIRQQDQEGQQFIQQEGSNSSKLINEESFTKYQMAKKNPQSYFKFQQMQYSAQLEDNQTAKTFLRT